MMKQSRRSGGVKVEGAGGGGGAEEEEYDTKSAQQGRPKDTGECIFVPKVLC